MSSKTASLVLNFIGFQVVWLSCVLGAAAEMPLAGPVSLLVFIVLHSLQQSADADDYLLAAFAVLIGVAADTAYLQFGLLSFASPGPIQGIAPMWILSLWAAFALTIRHSLAWLSGRYLGAAALGAIGGPIAYAAGGRLGGLELAQPGWQGLLAVGLVWAVVTPLLFYIQSILQAPERTAEAGA